MSAHMTEQEKEELACVYAALILGDEGLPVNADNIQHITKAANVRVLPFWPAVFARTLGKADITEMILHAGAAPAAAAPAAAAGAAAPAAEEKKEEKEEKKEEEEEEEGDFGLDLFA